MLKQIEELVAQVDSLYAATLERMPAQYREHALNDSDNYTDEADRCRQLYELWKRDAVAYSWIEARHHLNQAVCELHTLRWRIHQRAARKPA